MTEWYLRLKHIFNNYFLIMFTMTVVGSVVSLLYLLVEVAVGHTCRFGFMH